MLKTKCHCSVKIRNLSVKRGNQQILHDVSLTANHGEILALIGRNGAGKTTLLKAIINSVAYNGTIEFFNSKGKGVTYPQIGYVPQKLSFDRNTPLTVLDLFCTNSNRVPIWFGHSKTRAAKAKEILSKVGAENHIYKSVGRLSGGELQRVLLAFALDPVPDILLLDEPVSAVDRRGISTFYSLITSMRKEYHMPIVIVSHDLAQVRKYATAYALIDHTILETDRVENMLQSKRIREIFGLDVSEDEMKWK